ncbi:uncharacterized protein APUU_22128S [Aspergillus puulaauensis]|uniref:Uncharacterized protein n=1 Tax=Aspergillus puulaauensis TaxID=1220207 RepID=A0A7R7XHY3_9EURO|nr:uncharacterized protein APUU_22128S [Aspergillus puulaauensis]BCS21696.1 hypothetical protein APUU_22128S [Aspergillus puulaauensis]
MHIPLELRETAVEGSNATATTNISSPTPAQTRWLTALGVVFGLVLIAGYIANNYRKGHIKWGKKETIDECEKDDKSLVYLPY